MSKIGSFLVAQMLMTEEKPHINANTVRIHLLRSESKETILVNNEMSKHQKYYN